MSNVFRTAIVHADQQSAAQEIMGDGTFMTGLSTTGEGPVTHYITSGQDAESRWLDVAALDGADVSVESPDEAIARLGLMRVPWPEDEE